MKTISRFFLVALLIAGISGISLATDDPINPKHPDRYVVQKGDTLWDISARFLRKPWLWPEIWYVNPQIKNPHLIYPGDELELVYIDGKPRLRIARQGPLRLSPRVRANPLADAIPAIPIDAIAPFLTRPLVAEKDELEQKPYIVAFADEHLAGGAGQRVYVRSIPSSEHKKFDIVRSGQAYKDGDTGEILGYEALLVGIGSLRHSGDPATVFVDASNQEVLTGDRVIPTEMDAMATDFHPHAPAQKVEGNIIAMFDGITQIGQYDIVVLDRGHANGLDAGTVLQVKNAGETIPDNIGGGKVTLPDESAGLLMVFRSFDRVSFGIIMHATRAMHVGDRVVNP
ncbi:MAG TPA: LysM peptidoglycan-binding domain-containing protein [Thiolapillus brandeum]|uniref:LysM peptidoglycan-binding domain-containing protein n=1 Tax=Thiolapillus brandeum TaxID=1076588 RepID=A0A831JS80_9GAMM|nr:LysM peptidoglycan-binding domain-containing protein [Thiolapillus brandeum]